jgi:hypothetical protein
VTSPHRPFAVGITLDELKVETTNSKGEPTFITSFDTEAYKVHDQYPFFPTSNIEIFFLTLFSKASTTQQFGNLLGYF